MDWSLKPCMTTTNTNLWKVQNRYVRAQLDRLTSLPDELLVRILSLLPTKDAAATSALSRGLRRVFPLITSLDFDISPLSLCLKHPFAIERYATFVTFVNTVLKAHQSKYLTRFRLKVGSGNFATAYFYAGCSSDGCKQDCLPDLRSTHLNEWISFPLTFCGLRELDLCILVRDPGDSQLPRDIFTCQTLQVLKLEVNLGFDQVISMPSYCLPNLKLLIFISSFISDDGFLPRLVSSCPSLEDLTYETFTNHVCHLTIRSTSLRRLCLRMHKNMDLDHDNSDFVLIHTPNLECLEYTDNLAFGYSIPIMHCLVKARLFILFFTDFHQLHSLMRPVSSVQHLSLFGDFTREFYYADVDVLKEQLPVFPNLKHLEVGYAGDTWNKFLLPLLNCSPVLETLVFEQGVAFPGDDNLACIYPERKLEIELELEFFRRDHPIPSCCRYHLKRIVIKQYCGVIREVEMVKFFLRHALVLEELIIKRYQTPFSPIPDQMSTENTLKNLPKASPICSIQVS